MPLITHPAPKREREDGETGRERESGERERLEEREREREGERGSLFLPALTFSFSLALYISDGNRWSFRHVTFWGYIVLKGNRGEDAS